jgi:short-subunit dehydrogenase
MAAFKSILITGASSGIGEDLALQYSTPGVHLAISGRNQERLEAVADACREKGADVESRVINVSDGEAMEAWINVVDARAPLDLVIANAGIGVKDRSLSLHNVATQTFEVNVNGVFNTIHPALELMKGRRSGQIVIISSVAGFIALPFAPAYSASKHAVKGYGQALRATYAHMGIKINVICPGFVESRMTDSNAFAMPFLLSAEKAVKLIMKAIAADKGIYVFPWQMRLLIKLSQIMPSSWVHRLIRVKAK